MWSIGRLPNGQQQLPVEQPNTYRKIGGGILGIEEKVPIGTLVILYDGAETLREQAAILVNGELTHGAYRRPLNQVSLSRTASQADLPEDLRNLLVERIKGMELKSNSRDRYGEYSKLHLP